MISKIHLRNVKGVTGCFDLGQITNLIGPNGSGKSAILEGLKIGMTGYTELGKLPSKTYQLASDKVMEITLESQLGRTLTRRFERSGSGAKQIITLNGEVVAEKDLVLPGCFDYPVESIHPSEFLNLSPEKRADFVFSALGSEINSISPEDLPKKFEFFTGKMSFSDLMETLKAKKSELEKEIKRCLANLQKLTGDLGEMPAGNLNEWEEKKAAAAAELEKVVSEIATNEERAKLASSKAEQAARLQKNIDDSAKKIIDTEQSIEKMQARTLSVPECKNLQFLQLEKIKQTKALTVAQTAKADLDKRLETLQQKGCCPFCNALASSLENVLDEWELMVFNLATEIETLETSISEIDFDIYTASDSAKIAISNDECQRSIRVDQDALKSYRKFYAENIEALEKLNRGNDEAPVSLEILQGKAEGLRVQIREADENIKKFVSVQSVRNKKSEAEKERNEREDELETIKSALDEVKKIRDTRLADASVELAAPFGVIVRAAFGCPSFLGLIGSNDKPCFDFGIVRNDKEIGFDTLSGGEKTIMLTALVACIQIVKTGKPGIGLFELAEADDDSVLALINAVTIIGFDQVVFASCHGKPLSDAVNIAMAAGEQKEYIWSESREVAA